MSDESPKCTLKKWISRDGEVRLYLNSSEIPEGVNLWLSTKGMVEGFWRLNVRAEWMTNKSEFEQLGYELLRNTFGKEFSLNAKWEQLLEVCA